MKIRYFRLFKDILSCILFFVFAIYKLSAQVEIVVTNPSNTTPNLAAAYTSLADAIAALNSITSISGPVTFTAAAGSETAPAGGYIINFTAETTITNNVVITGTTTTIIVANSALTVGAVNDAIFKIIGSDFVTIQNFSMIENVGNTIATPTASNNMTEFGVAVFYASTTNGCQGIILDNNIITLNRVNRNTFGIYSNSTHSSTNMTAPATASGPTGGNHNLTITRNSIYNVNQGIVVVGPTLAPDQIKGLIIGGSSANANSISNYGTGWQGTSYHLVNGTMNGILLLNVFGYTVSYNIITSSAGGVSLGTVRGIYHNANTYPPTLTFVNIVSNNTISVQAGGTSAAVEGIKLESGCASNSSSIYINGNNFTTLNHTVAGANTHIRALTTLSPHKHTTINNNSFTNLTTNTSNSFTFLDANYNAPLNGTKTVNGNNIVTAFNKTGSGGIVTIYKGESTHALGTTIQNNNNNFSNITLAGTTYMYGWLNHEGSGSSPQKTISGNTFTNWTCGTSSVDVLQSNYGNLVNLSNNIIHNINGQSSITGLRVGANGTYSTAATISNNTINNLSSTGSGGTVIGITFGAPLPMTGTHSVINNTIHSLTTIGLAVTGLASSSSGPYIVANKIYNIQSYNTGAPSVSGILVSSGGGTINITNNLIGNLFAPNASTSVPVSPTIRGINLTSTTLLSNLNIQYNTVYINATSTGTNFSTTALFHTANNTLTTAQLFLRNNIFINLSNPNGTGLSVAYQRSATTLSNYNSVSNNNIFYADTPGAANIIFYDGTNLDQTLSEFKARVIARETNSATEFTPFLTLMGFSPDFLHIDPATNTLAKFGGTPIVGISADYDGNARNATTPDIGADEFSRISLNTKVFLSNVSDGIMDDYLRTLPDFPLVDVYTNAPYSTSGLFTYVPTQTPSTTTQTILDNNNVVDWVFVELRTGPSGSTTIVASKTGLLKNDGSIINPDGTPFSFFGVTEGNYKVAIKHRNHCGFMTDITVEIPNAILLDMTDNSVTFYEPNHDALKLQGGVYAMWTGDATVDASVDGGDVNLIRSLSGTIVDEYNKADVTLDGSVDGGDVNATRFNSGVVGYQVD